MAANGNLHQQDLYKNAAEQYPTTSGPAEANPGGTSGNGDLSKDEVGWYFVEQYYTTLSKSPEKLHLFYGKRSQFVSGLEAEVAPVSVGRSAIQDRIRKLDFQDCKVRVSNVDSQASFDNIVIQVIGETSNKSAELKKFCQTFVLAQQPTGYFVLNDIFRYINDDGEEEPQPTVVATEEAAEVVEDVEMPKVQTSTDKVATPLDADVVAQKLEESIHTEPAITVSEATNGGDASKAPTEATPNAESSPEEHIPTPEDASRQVEEEATVAEKPLEPASTPAATDLPLESSTHNLPTAPPKLTTWASRVAATGPPKPVVPVVASKTAAAPAQSRPASVAKTVAAQNSPSAVAEKAKDTIQPDGWQTACNDHAKRQNRPQSISGPPEKEGTMGYVRNVTEKVDAEELRAALASHGQLIYFDVNRQKNCAFVEFATIEGYNSAAAANPHSIGGEQIYVEPRRPKAAAYGGNGYSGARGGSNQRGRGGFDQGRSGNQGSRGNIGTNRGRAGAPRGRGAGQATNA